jgi:hypothetical protein
MRIKAGKEVFKKIKMGVKNGKGVKFLKEGGNQQ